MRPNAILIRVIAMMTLSSIASGDDRWTYQDGVAQNRRQVAGEKMVGVRLECASKSSLHVLVEIGEDTKPVVAKGMEMHPTIVMAFDEEQKLYRLHQAHIGAVKTESDEWVLLGRPEDMLALIGAMKVSDGNLYFFFLGDGFEKYSDPLYSPNSTTFSISLEDARPSISELEDYCSEHGEEARKFVIRSE